MLRKLWRDEEDCIVFQEGSAARLCPSCKISNVLESLRCRPSDGFGGVVLAATGRTSTLRHGSHASITVPDEVTIATFERGSRPAQWGNVVYQ
jgi:hypothetical protein